MKTKLKIILFAVVIMFLFTSQTFAMGAGQKHEEEIRIGAVLPLTGNLSYLGSEEKNTLMLLEKNINEKNEIKLKIFFEDSKGTAKDGLTAFNKLKMEGIKYYITSLTIVSLAIAPLCNQNGFIQFALSVDPLIAGQNKNLICLYYNLADEMKLISKLLAFKKAKDVASIYINTPEDETAINKFFKSYLKDYNIKHLGNYTYGFADKSVKNQLLKLKALDPDYINTIDFGYMYPTILKEAQVLGIREKIIGGLGMMTAPPMDTFLLSNIYFCASSFVIKPTEKYKIFAKKYEEKYGKSITFDGVYTYDSGNILYSNIRDNKNEIKDFVNKTYQGISGEIFIDSDGGSHVDISLAYYNAEGKINELIIND